MFPVRLELTSNLKNILDSEKVLIIENINFAKYSDIILISWINSMLSLLYIVFYIFSRVFISTR